MNRWIATSGAAGLVRASSLGSAGCRRNEETTYRFPETYAVKIDEEVLEGWVEDASLSVSTGVDASALIGIIADMVKDEYGFYWEAKIADVDVFFNVETPWSTWGGDDAFNVLKGRKWGPKRVILVEGDA